MSARLALVFVLGFTNLGLGQVDREEDPALSRKALVQALVNLAEDSTARASAWSYGLRLLNSEDMAWDKPRDWPSRDFWLETQELNHGTGSYALARMPVLRAPDFWKTTTKITLDDVLIFVGNERGHALQTVTLKQYLSDPRRYLHDASSWPLALKSLLKEGETEAVLSAQASCLPAVRGGRTEFVIGSAPSWQANLVVLATRDGTSLQSDETLVHNANGTREPLVLRFDGDASFRSGAVLLVEVPRKRDLNYGWGSAFGFGGLGGGIGFPTIGGQFGQATNPLPIRGEFREAMYGWERDPDRPIRVVVQFYHLVQVPDLAKAPIHDMYMNLAGVAVHPTEAARVLVTRDVPPDPAQPWHIGHRWWQPFWENRKLTPEQGVQLLARVQGRSFFTTSPRKLSAAVAHARNIDTPRRRIANPANEPPPPRAVVQRPNDPKEPPAAPEPARIEVSIGEPLPERERLTDDAAREALLKTVTIDLPKRPLEALLQEIQKQIGRPIDMDRSLLENPDFDTRWEMSLRVRNITALSALRHALRLFHGVVEIRNGRISVSAEGDDVSLSSKLYDVTGLGKPADLIPLIEQTVATDTWQGVGGRGFLAPVNVKGKQWVLAYSTTDVHWEIEALLDAFRDLAAGQGGLDGRPIELGPILESMQRTHATLDRKISFSVKDQSLGEVLDDLQSKLGVNVFVDRKYIVEEGIDLDKKITLDLKDVAARDVLRAVLEPALLAWYLEDEIVVINVAVTACNKLGTRIFDLSQLPPFPELKKVIMDSIDPDTWDEVGGAGLLLETTVGGRPVLIIRQSQYQFEQIESLLKAVQHILREATTIEWQLGYADGGQRIRVGLQEKFRLSVRNAPLKDVTAALDAKSSLSIQLDTKAFEDEGIDIDAPLTLEVQNQSLHEVFRRLLEPLQATYFIEDDETLRVTTTTEGSRLFTTLHDVSDLRLNSEELLGMVEVVDADTWDIVGGYGSALDFKLGDRHVLLVRQTGATHDQIRKVLQQLRQAH